MKTHSYKGTSVQMLLALRLIAENALAMVDKMKAVRAKWDEAYFKTLIDTIDSILKNEFAIDPSFLLKEKTEQVQATEQEAKSALQVVKTQVEIEFRNEPIKRDRILSTLGLTFVKQIGKASQVELVEMLTCFDKNLTPTLKTELSNVGIDDACLDRVCSFSETFYTLNTEQEVLKVGKKDISAAISEKLEVLYDEVINLSKLASAMLPNKLDADKLTYQRALVQIGYKEQKGKNDAK